MVAYKMVALNNVLMVLGKVQLGTYYDIHILSFTGQKCSQSENLKNGKKTSRNILRYVK